MNFRKVTSAIAALAISCASFAGLTLTAEAASTTFSENFEGETYTEWTTMDSKRYTQAIAIGASATSSSADNKYLQISPVGNGGNGVYTMLNASTTIANGTTDYVIEFDARITNGTNQASHFYVTSNNSAYNNYSYTNYVLRLGATAAGADHSTFSVNGNASDTVTITKNAWNHYRVEVINGHEYLTISGTDSTSRYEVQTAGTLDKGCKGLAYGTQRYYSAFAVDNLLLKTLSMPSLSLDKDSATIATGGNDTIEGTVTLGTAGDSVLTTASSDNPDVSVAVTNQTTTSPTITVTSTGSTGTAATITVTTKTTGANADDAETVSKDISVVVGALSYADVTVEYKDSSGNTLKSPTTVGDQIVNMPYTVTSDLTGSFDYTNPTTGVQYTASLNSNSPTSVASVAAEGSTLTLIFDLTEWKYSATVNTDPNTTVTISGTSTSGETVSETVVSSYTGVAAFTSSLYEGTSYTVTASKNGYTTNSSQSITVNTSGTATATVPALVPSTEGVVFYEDFGNGSNLHFTSSGDNSWSGSRYRVTFNNGTTDRLKISNTTYDKYTITINNLTADSQYTGNATASSSVEIKNAGTTFAGIKVTSSGSSAKTISYSGFIANGVQEDIKVNDSYTQLTGNLVVEIDKTTGAYTASFTGTGIDYSYSGIVENFDIENLTIFMGRGTYSYPYIKSVTITGENYPALATVTVTDGNNNSAPLSGATVTVGNYTATETSTPGTYTVSVPYDTTTGSSTYEVSVSKDGYPSNTGSITVTSSGGSTTVELTKVGYIINTKPYAAISIDGAAAVSTGRSGTYTFALGATGSHSVEISKDGYQTVTETVTPADNGHIDLPLSPNAGIVYQEDFTYVEDNFGFTNATVSNGEFTNGDGKNSGETVTLPETVDISGTVVTMRAKVSRLDRAVYLNFGPVSIYFNSAGQTNYSQNNTSSTTDYRLVQVYMPTSNDTTHRPIFYVDGVRYHTTDNARVANDAKSVTTFGYSNLGNALTAQIDYIKVEKLTSGDTEPTSTVTVNGTSTNYLVGTTAAFELGYNAIGTPTVVNTSDDSATGITPKASGNGYTFTVPANNVTVKCLGYSTPVEIDSYTTSAAAGYTKGDTITDGDGRYARGFTFMTYAGGLTYTNVSVSATGAQNSKFDKVNGSADYTTGSTATATAVSDTAISGDAIFGIVIWTASESKKDTIKNFDPSQFTVTIN